jgi:two-component system chemotaxis response regulator CheB
VKQAASPDQPAATELPAAHVAIVIAASAGGPRALTEVIPALPAHLPAAVLVAQHMPSRFTHLLAQRLDRVSALAVREAAEHEVVQAGTVYIAPGGRHMAVARRQGRVVITLSDASPVRGVRPAADLLFAAAATCYGPNLLGVVLTGMGRDGAEGLRAVRAAGGWTVVQDAAGAALAGMPRAAAEHAAAVLPLAQLAAVLTAQVQLRRQP